MANTKIKSYIIPGPLTSAVNYAQAEEGLKRHPQFPKHANVDYSIQEVEGRWVASLAVQSGPFPPSDSEDSGPPSPEDSGPPAEESPDSPDSDSSDGPPSDGESDDSEGKEKGEKGEKGGEKKELSEIHQFLQAIMLALGIPMPGGPEDSPVPGADVPPPPPGAEGPPGAGGPPPPSGEKHNLHPGDTPPGVTPLGSPAFSSVPAGHPWAHIVGKAASFKVNEPLGTSTMDQAQAELRSLAAETGFKVKQAREERGENGERRISAVLSIY